MALYLNGKEIGNFVGDVVMSSGNGGLSYTAKALLLAILRNGVYTSDQSQNIDTLETVLGSGGGNNDETTSCAIIYSLTDVTASNNESVVAHGEPYSTTLTPTDGYSLTSVTVTMGGADITNSAYANGIISIPSVTGIVVITAKAEDCYKWMAGYTAIVSGTKSVLQIYASRAVYASTVGDVMLPLNTGGESGYYPVPVPTGATTVTIESEGYCCSVNQLKLVDGVWNRIADSGWLALGGGSCTLVDGAEAIVCVAKYGTVGNTNIGAVPKTVTVNFS